MIRSRARSWRVPSRIVLLAAAGILVAIAGTLAVLPTPATNAAIAPPTLAKRLGVSTYGFAIPVGWLAAPIPGLREDDIVDLIGTRIGERATATEVASGLRVMAVDERALVVELRAVDADAIAAARARGVTFVPILRSAR